MSEIKVVYCYDAQGYLVDVVEKGSVTGHYNTTENPFPDGLFHPRFIDGEWVEGGEPPEYPVGYLTVDQKIAALEKENKTLKLKLNAQSDQYQFLEDVVTEIILMTQ